MTRMFGHRSDQPGNWTDFAGFSNENYEVHAGIMSAIGNHDHKAARKAMAVHMRRASRNMLSRYDWLQTQQNESSIVASDFSSTILDQVRRIQNSAEADLNEGG